MRHDGLARLAESRHCAGGGAGLLDFLMTLDVPGLAPGAAGAAGAADASVCAGCAGDAAAAAGGGGAGGF